MADKKISALTASSTPLAGTEVLPIVQSSTTKQVSVANLTAGRDVAMKYLGVDTATGFALAASIGNSSGYKAVFLNNDPGSEIRVDVNGPASAPGNLLFFGGTFGEYGGWLGTGDYRVKAGNVIIGTAGKGIDFSGNGGVIWRCGNGTPESAVTAPVGSLYTRTDGGANTTFYVKESGVGNTGWVAK